MCDANKGSQNANFVMSQCILQGVYSLSGGEIIIMQSRKLVYHETVQKELWPKKEGGERNYS